MSVIELVDSNYEIKLWYTAKTVARLELQGIELDDITELNIKKLTQYRVNGEQVFREAVETCKKNFSMLLKKRARFQKKLRVTCPTYQTCQDTWVN